MEHIEILIPEVVRPVIMPVEIARTESNSSPFIEANTVAASFHEVRDNHLIPVYAILNEPLISHAEFIDAVQSVTADIFHGEQILPPQIRLSHEVRGRIPEAKDKKASELLPGEKTVYHQRLMFVIEIPSIQSVVDGNTLSLTIGGVKNYSDENLYSRNIGDQRFKIFIGL